MRQQMHLAAVEMRNAGATIAAGATVWVVNSRCDRRMQDRAVSGTIDRCMSIGDLNFENRGIKPTHHASTVARRDGKARKLSNSGWNQTTEGNRTSA